MHIQSPTNKQEAQRYFRIGIRHYHECEFEKYSLVTYILSSMIPFSSISNTNLIPRALSNFTTSYQLYESKEAQAMIAKTLEFKRDEDEDDADEDDRLQQQQLHFDFKEDERSNSGSSFVYLLMP
jgi:hypothetical protein